jgi:hypothetical protein
VRQVQHLGPEEVLSGVEEDEIVCQSEQGSEEGYFSPNLSNPQDRKPSHNPQYWEGMNIIGKQR